jgi:hypothetical protein
MEAGRSKASRALCASRSHPRAIDARESFIHRMTESISSIASSGQYEREALTRFQTGGRILKDRRLSRLLG